MNPTPNNQISDEDMATLVKYYVEAKIQKAMSSSPPEEPKKFPIWKSLVFLILFLIFVFLVNIIFTYLKYG